MLSSVSFALTTCENRSGMDRSSQWPHGWVRWRGLPRGLQGRGAGDRRLRRSAGRRASPSNRERRPGRHERCPAPPRGLYQSGVAHPHHGDILVRPKGGEATTDDRAAAVHVHRAVAAAAPATGHGRESVQPPGRSDSAMLNTGSGSLRSSTTNKERLYAGVGAPLDPTTGRAAWLVTWGAQARRQGGRAGRRVARRWRRRRPQRTRGGRRRVAVPGGFRRRRDRAILLLLVGIIAVPLATLFPAEALAPASALSTLTPPLPSRPSSAAHPRLHPAETRVNRTAVPTELRHPLLSWSSSRPPHPPVFGATRALTTRPISPP